MKKSTVSKYALLLASASLGLMASDAAMAATLGGVANNVKASLSGVLDLLYVVAYIGGVVCGLLAAFKLKAHNDNPQQTPMKTPIVLFAVCAILVALPSFLQTSQDTVWGSGGGKSSATAGGFTAP